MQRGKDTYSTSGEGEKNRAQTVLAREQSVGSVVDSGKTSMLAIPPL
ncbi:hypothetical protein KR51_00024340 [Rubidibacter lacunae KORDI 51-2]|uniref:Uncharacterized protein n=1 Tax=Rubidibacter lacunae KORDI 51-2 TaxID=582515 RepID=U5DMU2_9CHRO|nr:hypothetical protein [Rubidibacter lacunae]ERN41015.1 hypothetical protein KR51_00024340 [Rubidibacter lacunae KORDI 51-2]